MNAWRNLIHILFTGPLLIYIGLYKPKADWSYNILLVLGIIAAIYFLYLITTKKWTSYHYWLFIHFIVFVPLLLYTGVRKTKTASIIYSLLLAIGIAAIGYHSVRLYQTYERSKKIESSSEDNQSMETSSRKVY